MTRWLNYFKITRTSITIKTCPIAIFAKVGSKLCQILNKASKKLAKPFIIVPKWRNFAKSGHTAHLVKEGRTLHCDNETLRRNFDHFCWPILCLYDPVWCMSLLFFVLTKGKLISFNPVSTWFIIHQW